MNNALEEHHFGDVHIIEIKDNLTMAEYNEAKKSIKCNLIKINVLWNSNKQCVEKGVLFVYSSGKRLYNIFVSENFYKIDEWQKMDKISVEKVIMVDLMTRKYYYSSMKHNEFGSTIFTRSFSNNPVDVSDLDLTAQEAYQDIQQLIGNLLDITGIENVMNWAEFYEIIYEGISSKIGSKNERKRVHFSRNHYEYLNVNL